MATADTGPVSQEQGRAGAAALEPNEHMVPVLKENARKAGLHTFSVLTGAPPYPPTRTGSPFPLLLSLIYCGMTPRRCSGAGAGRTAAQQL
jgi:hypothetical protein